LCNIIKFIERIKLDYYLAALAVLTSLNIYFGAKPAADLFLKVFYVRRFF